MPRHQKKAKGGGKRRGCLGALMWMMTGLFLGLSAAAAVAVYVNQLHLPFADSPTRDATLTPEQSRQRSREEALDFHDTLRQRQALPLAEDEDAGEVEGQTPAESSARKFVWYLQVGAFGSREQAESRRAELAFSGYAAAIRPGKTASGDIYRVWIGPFADDSAAEETRARLALEGYVDIPLLKSAAE